MLRALLLTLCGLALLAPAAMAQDDIMVDPGSPSGKEYALPVDTARSQAARGVATRRSDGQAAPPFGEGVQATEGASGMPSQTTPAAQAGKGAAPDDASGSSPRAAARPSATLAQAAAPDGGNALVVIAGVGGGVLLAGGLIGLALRRRATG